MKIVLSNHLGVMGVVGESTGYVDKNERSLFVGDIVRITQGNENHLVVMVKGREGSYCEGKYFLYGIEADCDNNRFLGGWEVEYVSSITDEGDHQDGRIQAVKEVE